MALEELKAFLLVAEHQSFSAAAAAMSASRTSLRRHVDALEAMVGAPLFERGHAGVVLTEAGRMLVERGRFLSSEFAAVLAAARAAGAGATTIRVVLPTGLPPVAVSTMFELIHSALPDVRTHIRLEPSPLTAGNTEVDLLVWFGLDAPTGAWECHTVAPCPLRLMASSGYLARRGMPQTAHDLYDHALLCWSADPEPRVTTVDGETPLIRPLLVTPDADFLYTCARRDMGIAWVPDGALPAPATGTPLSPVLAGIVEAPLELRIAVRSTLAQVPRFRTLLDQLPSFAARAIQENA